MGSCDLVYNQGNSYYGGVLTSLSHVWFQHMYHKSYPYNLYANETIQTQPRASHICHMLVWLPGILSELLKLMKLSFYHCTLSVAIDQSPSPNCTPADVKK